MSPTLWLALLGVGGALSGFWLVQQPHSIWALLGVLTILFGCMHSRGRRWARWTIALSLLLVAIPLAALENTFLFELLTQIGIFAAMALGLNVVVGMAGLLDLGYAAFFAMGAYTWAIFGSGQASEFMSGSFPLAGWPYFYIFCALAVITAALTGTLIGLPALRLRGDYLAVVTLGLGQVVRVLANNLDQPINITNGPQGITPVERPPIPWLLSGLDALGFDPNPALGYALFFYLLVLGVMGAVVLINVRLDRSRFGRAWVAIREDEIAARAAGYFPAQNQTAGLRHRGRLFRHHGRHLRRQAIVRQPGVLHPAAVHYHPGHGHPGRHGLHSRRHHRRGRRHPAQPGSAQELLGFPGPSAPDRLRAGPGHHPVQLRESVRPGRAGQIRAHDFRHHPDSNDDLPPQRTYPGKSAPLGGR
jgi:ABC-type branched-subunit amino acid transport system permease subunit